MNRKSTSKEHLFMCSLFLDNKILLVKENSKEKREREREREKMRSRRIIITFNS
jgi:hypothetical protein